jgi:chromosome segregation protein
VPRWRRALAQVTADRALAAQDLAAISDAVIQEQLQAALAVRGTQESALAERRDALEVAASQLRGIDEERLKLEQPATGTREDQRPEARNRRHTSMSSNTRNA